VIMGGMAMPVEQPPVTTKQGKLLKK
jgi:hypothetical protein